MTTIGDLAFVAAISMGPGLVLTTFVLLLVTHQPRWVSRTVIVCWGRRRDRVRRLLAHGGRAFGYADANRSVPAVLDQATHVAMAACLLSSLIVVALGASRLVAAWNSRPKPGSDVPFDNEALALRVR
ncbi:hypothetical protein [Marmoricola sp. Leaf446]|uniref:hypothetical protein n=1 Tax=Marmoricola sp. Leaf446 TaxID=1736379 RepID=UPI0012E3AB5A|nr:hypothetical protein [Marmoricola sp. Leaf446]